MYRVVLFREKYYVVYELTAVGWPGTKREIMKDNESSPGTAWDKKANRESSPGAAWGSEKTSKIPGLTWGLLRCPRSSENFQSTPGSPRVSRTPQDALGKFDQPKFVEMLPRSMACYSTDSSAYF